MITGHTRIYGIVADPIHHVKTPEEMNALLSASGHDGVLIPFHVRPPELAGFMDALRGMQNFGGLIATVPHKTSMLAICDQVEGDSARIGAVNAVRRDPDGRLIGAMLDGRGFVAGLRAEGVDPADMDVCLLGAGGAGAAIAFALAEARVARLTIANRSLDKARDLARRVADTYPGTRVQAGPPDTIRHDLIVNATSLGLRADDALPLDDHAFRAGQIVAEAIMEPELTPLLALARDRGARIHFGRPMLRHQIRLMAQHLGALPSSDESA